MIFDIDTPEGREEVASVHRAALDLGDLLADTGMPWRLSR